MKFRKPSGAKQWDMGPVLFWVLVVVLIAGRLVLASCQDVYVWIDGAPLDDELMFRAAQSITAGNWLGAYDYLTLSKQMFFAVWLAFLHLLGVPYLMGGQLLMSGGAYIRPSLYADPVHALVAKLQSGRIAVAVCKALSSDAV